MPLLPVNLDADQLTELLESLGFRRGGPSPNPPAPNGGDHASSMTATQKIFNDFHVKADGSETADQLQKAIDKLMNEGENIIFPPGHYVVNDTIHFAAHKPEVRVLIQGFNVTVEGRMGDQPWTVNGNAPDAEQWDQIREHPLKPVFEFSRSPHEWQMRVEGFEIKSTDRGVVCLETQGITQSSFRDMTLAGWVAGRYEGWTCVYDNIVHKSAFTGGWWYSGSRGLNSNANLIQNCRTYGAKWGFNRHKVVPWAHFLVEGGGNHITSGCTHEGNASRYQLFCGLEKNAAYALTVDPIHVEIQEWAAIERKDMVTIGMAEQRHRLILNEMPRYGLRSFKDRLGNITVHNAKVGDKDSQMPRPWEGVGRNVTVYGEPAHGAFSGQQSADKWLDHFGVSNAALVVNGQTYRKS